MDHRFDPKAMPDLVDAPGIGTYSWEVTENRVVWSRGLARLYGLTAPPTDEAGFLGCVHPEDRVRVEAETSSFLEQGSSYSHRFRILRPDGQIRLILDRGTIERNAKGSAVRLLGVNIDLTDETADTAGAPQPSLHGFSGPAADRSRRAGETAGFGFYDFDIQSGRALWSRELLRILGREGDGNTGSMEMALSLVHPDDRDRVREEMTAAVTRLGPYDLEYRLQTPERGAVWVRDRGETFGPVDSGTGRARRATGVLNDISPRKATETALQATNALLEAMFDEAPMGFAVLDKSFRFVRVNRKLSEINGLPIEAHIGKRPDEILEELEGLDALYGLLGRILETREPCLNVEISGKTPGTDGEQRIWREHFFPVIENGEAIGIAVLLEDVTVARNAENALAESARQLRRVIDGNIGFVGILDIDGTVREANATALQAGGLERDEVIGRKFWDTAWWNYEPAVAERLKAAIAEAATGQAVRYDAVVRMQGDTRMTIDFLITPVFDDDGKVTHLLPSGFDITEREEALKHVQLLMQEVNHRSKNILSLVQVIARQTVRTSPEDFMAKFSDRIGALARAQDLLIDSNWNSVDLETLIRNQLAHFGDALDRRILLSGPALTINAQAAQSLSMLMHELATNAGKYGALSAPEGRVRIVWDSTPDAEGGAPLLSLDWLESGGPKVSTPVRRGFGSTLIDGMVKASFGVAARLDYAENGLKWRLEGGREAIVATDGPASA